MTSGIKGGKEILPQRDSRTDKDNSNIETSFSRKRHPISLRFESFILYIYPSSTLISIITFSSTLFFSIFLVFILSTITNLSIRVLVGRPCPSPRCLLIAWSCRTRRFQIQVIKWRHLWEPFESKSLLCIKAKDKPSNMTSSTPPTDTQINQSGTSVPPVQPPINPSGATDPLISPLALVTLNAPSTQHAGASSQNPFDIHWPPMTIPGTDLPFTEPIYHLDRSLPFNHSLS